VGSNPTVSALHLYCDARRQIPTIWRFFRACAALLPARIGDRVWRMAGNSKIVTSGRLRSAGAAWLVLGAGWVVVGTVMADQDAARYVLGGIVAGLGTAAIILGTVSSRRGRH
jgi:hypothetical protein